MLGDIPPFGGADDRKTRVAAIERNIETAMQPRTRNFDAEDYPSAYGGRDPRRGFTCATAGDVVRIGGTSGNNRFLDSLSFAACSFWSCDAPQAVLHKACDVRRYLARAVDQLPSAGKCAVHLGLETLDGPLVEQGRLDRTRRLERRRSVQLSQVL